MQCEDFLPLVEKLADGEVTSAEKREAEAHLKACEDCREHFRFLKALPNAARQASPSEPPEIYWEALPRKIMARIARMEEREKPAAGGWFFGLLSPSGLRWAGAVAAALVAAVVGLQVLDAPFSSQPSNRSLSQDAPQAPSVSSLSENARSGKEGQPVVGLLESEGESARPPAPATPQTAEEGFLRDEPSADDADQALQKARAVGEVGPDGFDELDEVESNEPEPEEVRAYESDPASRPALDRKKLATKHRVRQDRQYRHRSARGLCRLDPIERQARDGPRRTPQHYEGSRLTKATARSWNGTLSRVGRARRRVRLVRTTR